MGMLFEHDYTFCDYRECECTDCLRHKVNTPFNTLISMSNFKDFKNNKTGKCDYFLGIDNRIDIKQERSRKKKK